MTQKAVLCWSGGKDSARALYEVRRGGQYEIVSLLSTITRDYDRVSMHGVRTALIENQARQLRLPLEKVFISAEADNTEYESHMQAKLEAFKQEGISRVIFGDIFLEDIRKYREDKLARIDMQAVFPLWQRNTAELALSFIDLGFKAITTCVDGHVLNEGFAGRIIDRQFLASLPPGADLCGENGEFHSFVFDGPLFDAPVKFKTGKKVLRESFHFCDLIPAGNAGNSGRKESHRRVGDIHLSPCIS
jgi:uncharacterized protein (TIGR00290 family)